MTAKTPAQRKAEERQRNKQAGLKRLELWALPENHEEIKVYAELLELRTVKWCNTIASPNTNPRIDQT